MSQRFLSRQRVKKNRSFTAAIRRGFFYRGASLNLWTLRQREAQLKEGVSHASLEAAAPCLGIIVSRKAALLAVKRNLWKRRIREAFRKNQNKISAGWALIIQAKKRPVIPTYQEIEEEFLQLCTTAKVINRSKRDQRR